MGREIAFNFSGYGGWQFWMAMLPKPIQSRWVAKSLLKDLSQGWKLELDLKGTPVYLVMPWATYQILDTRPTLKPCARERVPGL